MELLVQQLVNGFALGTTYALLALGFVLVFGVLRVLNVAHGDVVMLGAYSGLVAANHTGNNLFAAIAAAILVTGAAGWLLERIAIRPVSGSEMTPFLTTLGAAILIQGILRTAFTAQPRPFPINFAPGSLDIGGILIGKVQLVTIVVAGALVVICDTVVHKTQLGRRMRAVAENPKMAASLGINALRIRVGTIVVASALAGLTGILLVRIYGIVTPTLGIGLGLKGMIILIVGGLGSFRGAIAVALFLGLAEVLVSYYFSSGLRDVVAFLLLVGILLLRPTGLAGRRRVATAAGSGW
jgi:branched-chain amino acid transport system permease protein